MPLRFRTVVATRLLLVAVAALASHGPPASAASAPAPAIDQVVFAPRAQFAEPLIAIGPTTAGEDRALERALAPYEQRQEVDDLGALTGFFAQHPHSGWRVALLGATAPTTRAPPARCRATRLGSGAGSTRRSTPETTR
jgi:hypothetical protein